MLANNWVGYAETVLANSNQKLLSVHEILDSILQSITQPNILIPEGVSAYTNLAAALFSEIQKPESKFLRSDNKFALRHANDPPSLTALSSDRNLCSRRQRRTSPRSLGDSPNPPTEPLIPVKLSTATNKSNRYRTTSVSFDSTIMNNYCNRITRMEKLMELNSIPVSYSPSFTSSQAKHVRFAPEKNEVFVIPSNLDPFPSIY